MNKFQLDFSHVPDCLQKEVRRQVEIIAAKYKYQNSYLFTRETANFFIFGQNNQRAVTYGHRAFLPDIHPLINVLNWGEWNKLLTEATFEEKVRVNKEYEAVVYADYIQVGCQRVEFSVIDELTKMVAKARASKLDIK